jgi:chorismate-pyruvate lyase
MFELRHLNRMSFLEQLDAIGGRSLNLLQRLLLVNDGTLTDALESAFLEPIALVKLSVDVSSDSYGLLDLAQGPGLPVMYREILLRGSISRRNFVFAKSWIAVNRLPAAMRGELMESGKPIGRLWTEYRLETAKEVLRFWREPAGDLSIHFGGARDAVILARSYRVLQHGTPLMVIAEYFPADLSLQGDAAEV